MDKWFEHLIEQVALAHDNDAVKYVLEKSSRKAGFRSYTYLSLKAERQWAVSNCDREWHRLYFEKSYALVDPVVQIARSRFDAFTWSYDALPRRGKPQRNFCAEAVKHGICSGLTVPIKTGFGRVSMLTLASDNVAFAKAKAVNPALAASAVAQIHSRLERISVERSHQTSIRLKSDELTCLRWSAEGKSMKDIATIEDIRYSNVAFHLRNAKMALGAISLPQATAMAKELGLI